MANMRDAPIAFTHMLLKDGEVWEAKLHTLESGPNAHDDVARIVTAEAREAGVESGVFLFVGGWNIAQYVCKLPEHTSRKRAPAEDEDDGPIVTKELIQRHVAKAKKERSRSAEDGEPIVTEELVCQQVAEAKKARRQSEPPAAKTPRVRKDYDAINREFIGNGESLETAFELDDHLPYGNEPLRTIAKRGGFYVHRGHIGFFPAPTEEANEDEDDAIEDEGDDEEGHGYWLADADDEAYLQLHNLDPAVRASVDAKMKAAVASMFFDNHGFIMAATVNGPYADLTVYQFSGSCTQRVFLADMEQFPPEYIVRC